MKKILNRHKHPCYGRYNGIKTRCYNPNTKDYPNYGGRGITMCAEWLNPVDGFEKFVKHMGLPPPNTSLDRIDNDKGYEPGNCRWATRSEQNCNTRRNKQANYVNLWGYRKKWRVIVQGKYLGIFDNYEDALKRRDSYLHGYSNNV